MDKIRSLQNEIIHSTKYNVLMPMVLFTCFLLCFRNTKKISKKLKQIFKYKYSRVQKRVECFAKIREIERLKNNYIFYTFRLV